MSAAPTPTTAIRHLHSKGANQTSVVIVYPNDGRYAESFRIPDGELRRFCWAVLAQLDPAEARAAAAEDGHDLHALIGDKPAGRGWPGREAGLAPAGVSASRQSPAELAARDRLRLIILATFEQVQRPAQITELDLAALTGVPQRRARAAAYSLFHSGHIDRPRTPKPGQHGYYQLSDKGREMLADLRRKFPGVADAQAPIAEQVAA